MVGSLYMGAVAAYNGQDQTAAKCWVVTIVSLAVPSYASNVTLQNTSFGFLNKTYFVKTDDPYTRAELALLNFLIDNGKKQTVEDLMNGDLKLETYERAFRFLVPAAASGRRELLNQGSVYLKGAIPDEWNQGALPDGYNIAVTHVRTGFVADAVVTTPQAGIAYGSQPNAWPAALRNGQLLFSQAGALKSFFDVIGTGTMAAGFGSIGENDGLELQAPFILEENKATKFELYGATGQSFASPAGGNLLELILFGAMVRARA